MSLKGIKQTEEHKIKRGIYIGKHHLTGTPIHLVWKRMRQRCQNKNSKDFHHYGGRGIKICDEWNIFLNFYHDMKNGFQKGLELDRINNNGNYCKENCQWATRKQQVNNTRRCKLIEFRGRLQNLSQWADELKIPRSRLSARINAYKWPVERALTEPKLVN